MLLLLINFYEMKTKTASLMNRTMIRMIINHSNSTPRYSNYVMTKGFISFFSKFKAKYEINNNLVFLYFYLMLEDLSQSFNLNMKKAWFVLNLFKYLLSRYN